ncbi:MAG: hypothetical protein ABI148_06490 [Ginsengibacter sp.]
MKQSFLLLSLFFTSSSIFAQDNPSARWTKNGITVDGNVQDWNSLKHYDNQSRLFFDFKNDSNDLYLCFQTKDETNQAKIMRSGMKIILSDKINGKHKSIINFPLGIKNTGKSTNSEDKIQPDPLASHQSKYAIFLASDTVMEVKGFANINGLIFPNDISGIHAAINWDSVNTLTYEIAIPFKELFGNNFNLKNISKEISINVIINAMTVADAKSSSANVYSGRRGDGEHRVGGSPEEKENENRMAEYNKMVMSQKTELKQKFTLSMPQ